MVVTMPKCPDGLELQLRTAIRYHYYINGELVLEVMQKMQKKNHGKTERS